MHNEEVCCTNVEIQGVVMKANLRRWEGWG
jgi:hypothetical protein